MVGDSLTRDILGAQRAGLNGIWMNRSGSDATDQVTPDVQITNLSQLHKRLSDFRQCKPKLILKRYIIWVWLRHVGVFAWGFLQVEREPPLEFFIKLIAFSLKTLYNISHI